MAQRRQIRVSQSLEGGGERPARRYGVTPSRFGLIGDLFEPFGMSETIW